MQTQAEYTAECSAQMVLNAEFAKNRRCVAAAKIVLRSVGVSPSRNCDLGPRDTAANRDAVIGGSPSLCRIRENLKEEMY